MTPVLSTQDRPRSSIRRAIYAMGFVGIASAAIAWAAIQELRGLSLLDQSHVVSTLDLDQWELAVSKANELHLGTLIAAAIAVLAWLSRVVDNTPRLGGGEPAASPRASIIWWFVPVASQIKPYQIVADVWRRLSTSPAELRLSVVRAWWILWVVGGLVDYVILWLPAPTTLADARVELEADALALGMQALAGVLLVAIIREVERRADLRADLRAEVLASGQPVGRLQTEVPSPQK
ncbi:MAG: DUF4328 domain-containing protein [Candidatus Limnocylindrales bacterium]